MVSGKYNQDHLDPAVPHRLVPHVNDSSQFWYKTTQRNLAIMDKLLPRFKEIGEPPTSIALRWLMQKPDTVSIPIFSVRTKQQLDEALRAVSFTLSTDDMKFIDEKTKPAIAPPIDEYGAYPYPMLEYGSPALPNFYSRALLYGDTEKNILNHRLQSPYHYSPDENR